MGFFRKRGVKASPPGGDQLAEGRPRGSRGPHVLPWAAARALGPTQAWPAARVPPRAVKLSPPQPSLLPDVVIRERGIPALGKLGTSDTTWESF